MVVRMPLERKLVRLQKDLLEMGQITEEMIEDSLMSLIERDAERANAVISRDDEVDQLDLKIEMKCARIIATQQPMARDLRIIATALKIITDVERIGDYCVDIARKALVLAPMEPLKPYVAFPMMGELIRSMLHDALHAYAERDVNACQEIGERDKEVDRLYNETVDELIGLMKATPQNVERGAHLMLVGRYLERIGDHITNIAERIVYMETGELVELNY